MTSCSGAATFMKPLIVCMSVRKRPFASGYCTFTATSEPSARSTARCTWPIDAEPSGASSNSEKVSDAGFPVSSRIVRITTSFGRGGTLSSSLRSCSIQIVENVLFIPDAIWPYFVYMPCSCSSSPTTAAAYFRSSARHSRSAASSGVFKNCCRASTKR